MGKEYELPKLAGPRPQEILSTTMAHNFPEEGCSGVPALIGFTGTKSWYIQVTQMWVQVKKEQKVEYGHRIATKQKS